MRRDKRVIVEREGEVKIHLPGGSSKGGFKRIQADNASINVFLGEPKSYPPPAVLNAPLTKCKAPVIIVLLWDGLDPKLG